MFEKRKFGKDEKQLEEEERVAKKRVKTRRSLLDDSEAEDFLEDEQVDEADEDNNPFNEPLELEQEERAPPSFEDPGEWVSRRAARAIKTEIKKARKKHLKKIQTEAEAEWAESLRSLHPLPISRARPPWLGKTCATHRMYERGGIFGCARCGALGAYKSQRLVK